MIKHLIRSLIVFCIMSVIIFCLYIPRILQDDTAPRNSLNVFTWGDTFSPKLIEAFEKEYKVKVHVVHFQSNEELIVKMKATKGKGYDLVTISDYAIPLLTKENLLLPLDKKRFPFMKEIDPAFMGRYWDPQNTYSIPCEWEIFAIGYDKDFFKENIPDSWDILFKEPKNFKVTMLNDPIMAYLFGKLYLSKEGKSSDPLLIKKLLVEQKKWVEAYVDFRADYFLATKTSPVALATSSFILKAMAKNDFIGCMVPKEGSFISIEHIAISSRTKNADLAHKFISFFHREEMFHLYKDNSTFFPAWLKRKESLGLTQNELDFLNKLEAQGLDKMETSQIPITKREINEIWVEVKDPL